jgi:hypothetical protein
MRQGPVFRTNTVTLLNECFGPGERHVAKRDMCSKPLSAKSHFRAEEAQRDGTLILLERILQCECGARVGARLSPAGQLIPTRHFPCKAFSSTLSEQRAARSHK